NAIEKSDSTDYGKIVEVLQTQYVDTPLGEIKFDGKGDAEGVGFSVYQVQNGKYVELDFQQ
ncbi:MAG: branched-chain amino acid ABC transporter substrate-binding protein, partial [Desulfovibrionaceae bacterium]